MVDKLIPYYPVLMEKTDTIRYPHITPPDGYTIGGFQPGDEHAWARLQFESGQTDSLLQALTLFQEEFMTHPALLAQRCLFVRDENGTSVGTASLWTGEHFGRTLQRIHWVTVDEHHQGRGLAKALLTAVLDVYNDLGFSGYLYLTSQTWSYRALGLYERFGFVPYCGPKPPKWEQTGDFEAQSLLAWNLIREKTAAYR